MKKIAATALTLSLAVPFEAGADPLRDARASVAPALDSYAQGLLDADVWRRADLTPRDRSLVTVAVLIARTQSDELPFQIERALENGVTPTEIAETITHLAFYSGWANANAAIIAAAPIFEARGISSADLPGAEVDPLPLDVEAEAAREANVQQNFSDVAPGVVADTRDVLFNDLWLRPGLDPRDRSLVTVAALIGGGMQAQMGYHLNRAMDNGLTQEEAAGMLSHLAYYAGWPNIFSALPIARDVFDARSEG
ncbi:Carboxymuconolactone decarboxylase family protein [Aquimixticola soesokkakensis]|uniref:Carboxymuconolactone decarboxylase family protein n=1 Tax=Aquimixticola soesokkakensis TaxID=1519096 RepID=A0A1Y5TRS6_9RHOB|nr:MULTISPECIES: carboxymuconolactone decarboxylase family protein [Paracoccaceae]OCX66875.1 4-carboxymuconolactone decarboxylase [Thioclava sp. SK-1]SLN70464.1 Carboxymuconolactone decarboxylase family protein [Aquimixticola soesokkakensis]